MSDLFLLTKVFFKSGLGLNKKSGKTSNPVLGNLLLGLLFATMTGVGSFFFYKYQSQIKLGSNTLIIGILIAISVLTITLNFFQMNTSLFRSRDFEMLSSFPIKNHSIVGAKLLSLELSNLLIDILTMAPVFVFYMINGGTSIGLLAGIIGTLFASIIPLLFVTLVGALVAVLTANSAHSNLLSTIIYIVFFILFAIGLTLSMSLSKTVLSNVYIILPYYYFINQAIAGGEALGILYFVLINLAAIIVIVAFSSLLYRPINQISQKRSSGRYRKGKDSHQGSLRSILFKKEMNLVIRNNSFLLSSYICPVILFIISMVQFGIINKGFFEHTEETLKSATSFITSMYVIEALLICSFTTTTYASFSMEGGNFPLLFSYPLDKKEIIRAKIKAGIIPLSIMYAIVGMLSFLIVSACQGFAVASWTSWLRGLLFPILGSAVTTLIGTLCGMKWAKIDFKDPNDALKKGKAMGMTLLFSIIANVIGLVLLIFAVKIGNGSGEWYFELARIGAVAAYYLILIACIGIVLNKRGETMFNNIIQK